MFVCLCHEAKGGFIGNHGAQSRLVRSCATSPEDNYTSYQPAFKFICISFVQINLFMPSLMRGPVFPCMQPESPPHQPIGVYSNYGSYNYHCQLCSEPFHHSWISISTKYKKVSTYGNPQMIKWLQIIIGHDNCKRHNLNN